MPDEKLRANAIGTKVVFEKQKENPSPTRPSIQFYKLHPEAILPRPGTSLSVGLDLHAHLISESGATKQIVLPPRTSRTIETGLILLPPSGYFLMVCSRSGLAAAQPPVFVANAPGIIDPDYTGELKVILFNGGHESVYIRHGDRIAQVLLIPAIYVDFQEISILPQTERGSHGFGSTGR